jgi:hypothetical protein
MSMLTSKLCVVIDPTTSRDISGWLSSKICCVGCGAVIFKLNGVTCGNFGCYCGLGLGICTSTWHGKFYKQHVQDNFPVLKMQDLDDALMSEEDLEEDDLARFREARDRDHLLTTFQCNCCHFQIIK